MRRRHLPSPNRAPRPAGTVVDTLVLHYTGMVDAETAIAQLRSPAAAVSAHYVVREDGDVLVLVDEAEIAWHAGVSCWRGRSGLNATSIGIEIVNGGHDFGLPPYPDAQIGAVVELARAILDRWPAISPLGVVAHSDIAPMRKRDPGELFPWRRLAGAGIGLWPQPAAGKGPAGLDVTAALERIGYGINRAPQPTSVGAAVQAFQRRFLPESAIDGRADEVTVRRLVEVARAYTLAAQTTSP